MKSLVVFVTLVMQLFVVPLVGAEPSPVPTQPQLPTSPLIITAYQASIDGLDLLQIYNDSDEITSLEGMNLRYSNKANPAVVDLLPLAGLMKPNSHAIIAAVDVLVGSDRVAFRFTPSGWTPKAAWIESVTFAPVALPTDLKTDGLTYKRSKTTTGYSTAASALNVPLSSSTIEADLLYVVPPSPGLRVIDVLARAKTCTPFNLDVTCNDYVKLQMLPGFDSGTMADYRVRTGGSESITNSFSLSNASIQGEHILLRLRDDGEPMSLTNSGGFVWLEDIYGLTRYEETLTEYADAGSETYINQSWAFNDQEASWQWAIPNPLGMNIFPTAIPEVVETLTCTAGKYRNPETNRCRSIEEAVSELAACEEGKERNPVTNRCRSIITTAVATLTPCSAGEERNPLTNRCKQVLSATLASCDPGEERNPETNRCRKSLASADGKLALVEDIQSPTKSTSPPWLLIGAAVSLAAGYAVYEWRQEIVTISKKILKR